VITARWIAPLAIEVSGHANYAEKGKDIVCAGVSTLWGTLLAALDAEERKGHGRVEVRDCTIQYHPKETWQEKAEDIYGTVWRGFLLLSASYAEYVKTERTF
jgi:uncharacterized protein YsxB (DUF464 family)